jgi:hypothetical protein
MDPAAVHGHDGPMYDDGSESHDERALRASAYELQRAAGNVLRHAAGAESIPTLAITLAHVEEALDRLSVGMMMIAQAVATREHDAHADESGLSPDARALCFHLRMAAEKLHGPEDACQSSRMWTRRLLEAETDRPTPDESVADAASAAAGR